MSGARSYKLRRSLGDSWGDADYSSDGGASIHSASSPSDVESESEFDAHEDYDMATPLPPKITRASSRTPQDTPVKTPTGRLHSRHSQTPRSTPKSFQSTPKSLEPSFIMPSMNGSIDGFHNGSPLRNSQMRIRKQRQPSLRSQTGSTNPSPRVSSRRTSTGQPQHSPVQEEQRELGPWHYVELFRANIFWPFAQYILDVFAYALNHFMKPIFGTLLGIAIFFFIIQASSSLLRRTVQTVLSPICIVPGSSYLIPLCSTPSYTGTEPPDFEELIKAQDSFQKVVQASKDASGISAQMDSGRNAIRDLKSLVKYSQLPSRSQLEVEFNTFSEIAKEASEQLTKYNVKIGTTLNRVIITNDWTLRDLEGITEREASTGALTHAFSYLNPFSIFAPSPATLDELIFDRYVWHLSQVKDEIVNLIEIAQALKALLTGLEDQLDIIGDISYRDNAIVSRDRDELLSQLWTMLGGNRAHRKSFDASLSLLKKVLQYKQMALDHVTSTLTTLQKIAAELENLREDVAAPEVLGYRSDVPLRFHIEVISKSLTGLRHLQGKRLEGEREAVKKGLDKASDGDGAKGLPDRIPEAPTVFAKAVGE